MDGAAILCIEIAQNKAYTALFGVPTHDFSTLSKATRRFWPASHACACGGVRRRVPIKVDGEIVGAIGVSGAPRCRTTSTAQEQP